MITSETRSKYIDFISSFVHPDVGEYGMRDILSMLGDEPLQELFGMYYAKVEAKLSEYVKHKGLK